MPYVLLKVNDKRMNLFLRGDEVDNLLWASSIKDRFVLQDTATRAIIRTHGRLLGKPQSKLQNPRSQTLPAADQPRKFGSRYYFTDGKPWATKAAAQRAVKMIHDLGGLARMSQGADGKWYVWEAAR